MTSGFCFEAISCKFIQRVWSVEVWQRAGWEHLVTNIWLSLLSFEELSAIMAKEDDQFELEYTKRKKRRRLRCIGVIVFIIIIFIVGFLIGYFVPKPKSDHEESKKSGHGGHAKTAAFHQKFQDGVQAEELEKNLRWVDQGNLCKTNFLIVATS